MDSEKCKLHEENINLKLVGIQAHVQALTDLHEQSASFQKEMLTEIKEQTTRTNGRVTALEKNTSFWTWLIVKPYRLLIAIVSIIIISKFISLEMLYKIFDKLI